MIESQRTHVLNDQPMVAGEFVLYWMQASQRTRFNHALEFAIERGNELGQPIVVCFGLMDDYPEANERHYAFMLEGLADVEMALKKRGILLVVKRGAPGQVALHFSKRASMVVCDRGYQRIQKRWRDELADGAGRRVVQVESDVVVPVEVVSDHHELAARTIRPKIHRQWKNYMCELPMGKVKHRSIDLSVKGDIDVSDPLAALKKLKVDRGVKKSKRFVGGEIAAGKMLERFVKQRLDGYSERRNEPSDEGTSTMSPYLHFGQISPIEIALSVRESLKVPEMDRDSYVEEVIVRRELSMNFVHFNPKYDTYDCLPAWAKKTLAEHRHDERASIYSLAELESAKTHDPYWNAAQLEMTRTGFMHNYMRMYWGKKILEWTATPEEAFERTLFLNNKYFIDGRDPNGFANVAWIYGLHDRPWGPARKIFGTVRYMNLAGLERKFNMAAYVKWVEGLE